MQVLVARATSSPSPFTTSHSVIPTVSPRFTNRPCAVSFVFHTGLRKLIQLQRGERLALLQRGGERDAHRSVGDVAQDAAVQRAHRVGVPLISVELEARLPLGHLQQPHPQQLANERRRHFASRHPLHHFQHLRHGGSPSG